MSEEAIAASDIRCSIPMAGMVDSFNVSVAAGILMHHAAHDRIIRAVRATPHYSSLSWSNIVNNEDCPCNHMLMCTPPCMSMPISHQLAPHVLCPISWPPPPRFSPTILTFCTHVPSTFPPLFPLSFYCHIFYFFFGVFGMSPFIYL